MTKKELRSGDWVQYRNGRKRMVVLNVNPKDSAFVGDETYMSFKSFNNDLTRSNGDYGYGNSEYDIMKVWRMEGEFNTRLYNGGFINDKTLIWERKEAVEVTMKEVCAKFGYNVKIVKE